MILKDRGNREKIKKQLQYLVNCYKSELHAELLKRKDQDQEKIYQIIEKEMEDSFGETKQLIKDLS